MLYFRWKRSDLIRCVFLWICGASLTGLLIRETSTSNSDNTVSQPLVLHHASPKPVLEVENSNASAPLESSRQYKILLEWQRSYRRNGLGNQLFLYASLVGIASRNNLQPVIPSYSPVISVFRLEKSDHQIVDPEVYDRLVSNGRSLPQPEIYSAFCCMYFPFTEKVKSHLENDIVLHGAFQSWKYFHPEYSAEIKQSLNFRAEITAEADDLLKSITKDITDNTELVGIHVRRGDILKTHLRQFGHVPAPESYFRRAREYLESTSFTSLFYVVVTNDVPWARGAISGPNVVVLDKGKPDVALALLTKMKYLILSTGTFSWWAAYLSNAVEVLYFNGTPTPLSFYDVTFRSEDYYLPHWKGLS